MTAPDVVIIITDEERAAPTYEPAELRAWRETRLKGRRWFTDHGVDFARHYVAATACVPSRPSLLTGQYPDLHGVTQTDGLAKQADDSRMRWLRPGEVPTIGHWFRAAGYDTHYDGKWHVSHADIMVDGVPLPTNTADGAVIADNVERYRRADPLDPYGFTGWIGPEPHGGRLRDCGYVRDPLIAARVVAWLADRYARRRAGDADALRPFLLVVGFVNPHDIVLWPLWARRGLPFEARPDDPPPIPPSPTDHEDLADKPAAQLAFRGAYPSAYGPPVMVRRAYRRDDEYRWLYHRLHLEVDTPIDQVRLAVTSGGSGDAVLVLTSDHGDLLGAHGGLHQKWFNLYDEAVRVPLQIVRIGEHPTSPATVTDAVTSHVDLLPTLLGLAGIDAPSARRELEADHSEVHPLPGRDLSELVHRPSAVLEGGAYVMSRDNILEGDGIANAFARARGRTEHPPGPLQIRLPTHVGSNFEALIERLDPEVDGRGHLWKIVRTFDDPATWTEPHQRQLSARSGGGDVYRCEPLADQWELYDLDTDPIEQDNRWRDPGAGVVREHLVARLGDQRHRCVPPRNQPWQHASRRPDPPRRRRAGRRSRRAGEGSRT